jgi:ATP-binding cassette subfamily F protein uup
MNARAPILALKDVRLQDGSVMLFDGVDLAIDARVRACLVGRNGAGKSTLMKILMAQVEPDAGNRNAQPGIRISVVPQEPDITGDTLLDYATAGGAPDYRAEASLDVFGLDPGKSSQGLSGGETRRAALARAFAEEADLLLLDEPTNHLDILAIETLEDELKSSKCAALIVSHDRAFLERVTQRCFWLDNRKVRRLDKGFSHFDAWTETVIAQEADEARRLDKQLQKEEHWLLRGVTARRARNEGRRRKLMDLRQEKSERMRQVQGQMTMAVDAGNASGQRVVEAKHLSKRFGDRVLLNDFSTRIVRGDRIAIVGPNGAGKTTLLKVLLGQIPADSGTIKLGTNLEISYVDQARAALKPEMTLWDVMAPSGGDQILVHGRPKHVAAYAKDFLFKESQLRQPVASLSGGERNRLLLARALASPANLMVLDEPTNDLDMDTLDLLEEMLADYDGTLLLVSHDRDFIDRLATSTIALDGRGRAVETPGGWQDFTRQNPGFFAATFDAAHQAVSQAKDAAQAGPKPHAATAATAPVKAKLTFKDSHRLKELETLVPRLTDAIRGLEQTLEDPGLFTRDRAGFDKLMKDLDRKRVELAAAEEDWLRLEEKREALG